MNGTPAREGERGIPKLRPWLLAAIAVTALIFSWSDRIAFQFHMRAHFWPLYLIAVAINLALARVMGRLRNWDDDQTVRVIGLAVAIPLIVPVVLWAFMIFFGCALWNTLTGHYQCGL